jgi:diaminopimelate epimerase
MNTFSFVKMSGAGNDFIIFDMKSNPDLGLNSDVIKRLCNRREGIGADGVITISDDNENDFVMEYYNADGSTGSLCGNGSRCAIMFAKLTGRTRGKEVNFLSNGVSYSGSVINNELITFNLNEPKELRENFFIRAFGQSFPVSYINTGSPHVIIDIKDLKKAGNGSVYEELNEVPVYEYGNEIRYLKEFAPEGTNVNFITRRDDKVAIRTYERGVENETYSCGTGSVSAAIVAFTKYNLQPPVKLLVKSGDVLIVDFYKDQNRFRNVTLTGPAKVVFKGEISGTVFYK